jgi:hypothetical protein
MIGKADRIEMNPFKELFNRIKQLERDLRELRAGRRLEAASIGQGGITVKDGGTISVYDPAGNRVALLGDLSAFRDGMRGVWLARANGAPAFVASGTGENGDTGYAAMYDQQGNYIVSDDMVAGLGLGRPYIPVQVGEVSPPTATTTSGTFTDLASGVFPAQHKALYAYLLVRASDATTAGEARVTVDGTQYGNTLTIAAGSYTYAAINPFVVGLTAAEYANFRTVAVQARRTAGTGTVGVRVMSLIGLDSKWA